MFEGDSQVRSPSLKILLVLVTAAGIVPAVASAQNCRFSVEANRQILYSGQSANLNVMAHFPSPPAPGGAFAFASSTFNVYSSHPTWTSASGGAIIGSDVLGVTASQPHQPQHGILANPTNPFRVWHGVFTPQSNAPALVQIEADPADFFVYPSAQTSSSVAREAESGGAFLLVNPVRVGNRHAAPGAGATLQVQGDLVIAQEILADQEGSSVSIGAAWTGSLTLDSSTTIGFDREPSSFTATVQLLDTPRSNSDPQALEEPRSGANNRGRLIVGVDNVDLDAQRTRVGYMSVCFTGLESGGHAVHANRIWEYTPCCDPSYSFEGYLGGVFVASGDLGGDSDGEIPGLVVPSLPQTLDAHAGTGALLSLSGDNTWTLNYNEPVVALIRSSDGAAIPVTLDRIKVRSPRSAAQQAQSQNNLRQMSLGLHVFSAEGVQRMTMGPGRS